MNPGDVIRLGLHVLDIALRIAHLVAEVQQRRGGLP